jgi:rRNA-processing protein CGR1
MPFGNTIKNTVDEVKSSPETVPVDKAKAVLPGNVVKLLGEERDPQRGRNVSGRSWKVRPQKRASTLTKTSTNGRATSWHEKRQAHLLQKETQEMQTELREERRLAKVQKRERRLEQERRRMENEFRAASQSAQTLNYSKVHTTLKTMSKKQLRQIKKTRMNPKTGVVEYVPAYSK